jgi:hypothetical protein
LTGHLARTGKDSNACTVLARKHDGRSRCSWEDNTEMDLKEMVWEGVDWIHLSWLSDHWQIPMNTVLNTRVS